MSNEFTLELYQTDGKWVKQILVTDDIDELDKYEKANPVDEDKFYYSEWVIQYDDMTGEEMCSFPLY